MPIWISEAECAGIFNRVTCACECPLRQANWQARVLSPSPNHNLNTRTERNSAVNWHILWHVPYFPTLLLVKFKVVNSRDVKKCFLDTTNPNWVGVDGSVTIYQPQVPLSVREVSKVLIPNWDPYNWQSRNNSKNQIQGLGTIYCKSIWFCFN